VAHKLAQQDSESALANSPFSSELFEHILSNLTVRHDCQTLRSLLWTCQCLRHYSKQILFHHVSIDNDSSEYFHPASRRTITLKSGLTRLYHLLVDNEAHPEVVIPYIKSVSIIFDESYEDGGYKQNWEVVGSVLEKLTAVESVEVAEIYLAESEPVMRIEELLVALPISRFLANPSIRRIRFRDIWSNNTFPAFYHRFLGARSSDLHYLDFHCGNFQPSNLQIPPLQYSKIGVKTLVLGHGSDDLEHGMCRWYDLVLEPQSPIDITKITRLSLYQSCGGIDLFHGEEDQNPVCFVHQIVGRAQALRELVLHLRVEHGMYDPVNIADSS
jgi:hypothetical protein